MTPYSHCPADADHHSGTADTDSNWSSSPDMATAHTETHKSYRSCLEAVLAPLVPAEEGNSSRAADIGPRCIASEDKAQTRSCR